jgi:hypothetical protein
MRTIVMSLSSVLALVGCALDFGSKELESSTIDDAALENRLPVDGCTWIVRIGDTAYAPDNDSVIKIQAFTKNAYGTTAAKVRYSLTGNDGTVQCGFLTTQRLPEISITKITAP